MSLPAPTTFCGYFDRGECRSCSTIERPYAEQILAKEAKLRAALRFFSASVNAPGASPWAPLPTVRSAPQAFRNRAKMSVTGSIETPILGLLGERDLDGGRELLACPIHHPRLNDLWAALPALIRTHRIEPYRIAERQGELKGLIAFYSPHSRQMYLRWVLRSRECVSRIQKLLPSLQAAFPELVCVSANLQPIPHAILEGPEEIFLTPRQDIDHEFRPSFSPSRGTEASKICLKLSPQAFVQTNVETATALYQTAADWIAELRPPRMLELYCGTGAFSFFAAAQHLGPSTERTSLPEILGIEMNASAVDAATRTAQTLSLSQLRFKALDATQVERELAEFTPSLVLMNPPRRGIGDGVKLLQRALPPHLIYSSCSVDSLALDLQQLAQYYNLERAQIFDLFPHTDHFETLVLLARKSN